MLFPPKGISFPLARRATRLYQLASEHSQRVLPEAAVAAAPGNLLERQILHPTSDLLIREVESVICALISPTDDSDVH